MPQAEPAARGTLVWSLSSPAASAADIINRYLFPPTPSPALNRSSAFASSPGVCPTVGPEAPTSPCALDADCPGLQKCCPWSGGHRCMVPAPQGRTEMCSEGGVQLGSPGAGGLDPIWWRCGQIARSTVGEGHPQLGAGRVRSQAMHVSIEIWPLPSRAEGARRGPGGKVLLAEQPHFPWSPGGGP